MIIYSTICTQYVIHILSINISVAYMLYTHVAPLFSIYCSHSSSLQEQTNIISKLLVIYTTQYYCIFCFPTDYRF